MKRTVQALDLFLVPEVGIEPTLSQGEGDFESNGKSRRFPINYNCLESKYLELQLLSSFSFLGLFLAWTVAI